MRTSRGPGLVVATVAVVALAACRPEAGASPTADDPDPAVATTAPADPDTSSDDLPADDLAPIRQRCVDAATVLDERIEAEDFEFPEESELDDEELEEVMTPALEFDDGVAGPDERPDLAPMPPFDPATVPILELDLMVESCIESGVVSEADLYGDEAEHEGGDGNGDAEFCAELAALSPEEISEFAAEEGDEVVREEFAYCELPDPLSS